MERKGRDVYFYRERGERGEMYTFLERERGEKGERCILF